jgi:hypothetical protein
MVNFNDYLNIIQKFIWFFEEHDYTQKEFNNYAKKFLKEVFSDLDSFEDLSEIQNKFPEKIHQIKGNYFTYNLQLNDY